MFITAATRSYHPFASSIPTELQEEFTDDFVKLAISYKSKNLPDDVIVDMPFQCLLAHACKKN